MQQLGSGQLEALRVFAVVAAEGSFTIAASRLGVSKSSVSRAITSLEAALGVPLLHRTTRSVRLSTSGAELYGRVGPLLDALARAAVPIHPDDEPRGLLRVSSTPDLCAERLAEAAALFVGRWPAARVELVGDARVVDLAADGFDAAVRSVRGTAPVGTGDLVAKRVGTLRLEWFASPHHLARVGTPRTEDDLAGHAIVALRGLSDGSTIEADDMTTVRAAVRAGGGIGLLPTFLADADVERGVLVRVFPEVSRWAGTVWFVHPGGKPPPKVRAFREVVAEVLRRAPL